MKFIKIILIYSFLFNATAFAANFCNSVLRPMVAADEDFYVSIEGDTEVQKMANAVASEDERGLREEFQTMVFKPVQNEEATQFSRVILDPATKEAVGLISGFIMKDESNPENGPSVLFGYSIHKKYWGKGHATAAVKEMITEFSLDGVTYFYAAVAQSNIASQRVLEKAGFKFTGGTRTAEEMGYTPLVDEPFNVYDLTVTE